MSWIRSIDYGASEGRLRRIYDRIKGPGGYLDNIITAHGLRPHTLEGHMALYKNVLHHASNRVPKWFLEAIGVYVSMLNRCIYCVEHHFRGMQRLLNDETRAQTIRGALAAARPDKVFDNKECLVMDYVRFLTLEPEMLSSDHIEGLRNSGLDDGEILEINQVASYFAYANRMVLGLGISVEGDVLGLSPSSDSNDDWGHR